jgi:hypothetical protein
VSPRSSSPGKIEPERTVPEGAEAVSMGSDAATNTSAMLAS